MSNEDETLGVEIAVHAVRLMRNPQYRTAADVRKALAEDFPDVPAEFIDQHLRTICKRLLQEY